MGAPPPTDPRPSRPSLRGRGREILLGQASEAAPKAPPVQPAERAPAEAARPAPAKPRPKPAPETSAPPEPRRTHLDPASLPLTPEERAALLDFSPDSPAYHPDAPLAAPPARSAAAPVWPPEAPLGDLAPETVLLKGPRRPPEAPVQQPQAPAAPDRPDRDGLPLGERPATAALPDDPPYSPRAEVEQLTPPAPEPWTPRSRVEAPPQTPEMNGQRSERPFAEDPPSSRLEQAAPVDERGVPPGSALIQPRARMLLDSAAERDLVDLLVDDERIRQLSAQIEALQEELVGHAEGDPKAADLYLGDLLQAGSLLRASRANYDDARAIVYRVRADLNRQRRVEADIRRYRPRLVAYYVLWGIVLAGLFLLKAEAVELADRLNANSVAALYYPVLFGVAGALISSFFALERHTTKLRDFDPVHTSSYLINPLLGGAIGLLMFVVAAVANEDLLRDEAEPPEYAITYLLCLVAGMNQHHILRRLGDVLKRFGRG